MLRAKLSVKLHARQLANAPASESFCATLRVNEIDCAGLEKMKRRLASTPDESPSDESRRS